jgi:hypothetical protein
VFIRMIRVAANLLTEPQSRISFKPAHSDNTAPIRVNPRHLRTVIEWLLICHRMQRMNAAHTEHAATRSCRSCGPWLNSPVLPHTEIRYIIVHSCACVADTPLDIFFVLE